MHTKEILKKIVSDNYDKSDFYTRNLLREYLQIFILKYIYSSKDYKDLFFYGGTCLSQCYGIPRLSEDLDFVDTKKDINLDNLAKDVKSFFENNTDISPEIKIQKFRIYLKFPILKELGFVKDLSEPTHLFIKIEVFSDFDFCNKFKTEFKPIFKFNHSVLIKTFDIETLMATKVRAIMYRKWEKTSKDGKSLASVKGRDFFDLMWFLEKGIEPNLDCIEGVQTKEELKCILLEKVDNADSKSIEYDLKAFISDQDFVLNISSNIKDIIIKNLNNWKN
ncbi:MAG: nucleotidyl transferase AbiEii/AbiGii toxin family protein [Candidatus Pacebacteria bacterium]|nr:nucleotidyl transferase AbiEii/AbiGii toxin family protein [Candidatus Paceibacterota bacterium]